MEALAGVDDLGLVLGAARFAAAADRLAVAARLRRRSRRDVLGVMPAAACAAARAARSDDGETDHENFHPIIVAFATCNPLVSDRNVDFLLYEVLELDRRLAPLPAFAEHGRETYDLFIASARRLAREVLLPSYRAMDADPPRLVDGRVQVHPRLREIYPQLVALGLTSATRPAAVGGQQLPMAVSALGSAYLMAGNLSAVGYVGLTAAAAHLLEAFGSPALREQFMTRMYAGEWTGTMALTEPQAGSSLADVTTRATPTRRRRVRHLGQRRSSSPAAITISPRTSCT